MQFIDSHIHLQDYKTRNTQQIIASLRNTGCVGALVVAAKADDFAKISALADENADWMIPAFGVHPQYAAVSGEEDMLQLEYYLQKHPKAHIGECGLDRLQEADLERQIGLLKRQMKLATLYQRPLNIHIVRAEDVISSLKKELPERFVLHSFAGSKPFLEDMLNRGAYLSLNPKVLQRKAASLIELIPNERLLTESDAPYQAKAEDIPDFIEKLAAIRGNAPEKLAAAIRDNFDRLAK